MSFPRVGAPPPASLDFAANYPYSPRFEDGLNDLFQSCNGQNAKFAPGWMRGTDGNGFRGDATTAIYYMHPYLITRAVQYPTFDLRNLPMTKFFSGA